MSQESQAVKMDDNEETTQNIESKEDETEESNPKIEPKEDETEENNTQSDTRIEEPEEQRQEEQSIKSQEEWKETAPDDNLEEQKEESAPKLHASDGAPDEDVETADEVPEIDDRKTYRSRERSIGKTESTMKVSKKLGSRARMVVGEVIDIRRSSLTGDLSDKKTSRFMNSYVMTSENPFNPEKVIKVLRAVMEEAMVNLPYDPHSCVRQAKWASSAIRARVKQLNFDRYKIVSVVTIGEKHSQDFYSTCRFLWDTEKDRYTSYAVENTHVFAVGLCFGMYYE